MRSSTAARWASSSRFDSIVANGSSNSASAAPCHSASASRSRSRACGGRAGRERGLARLAQVLEAGQVDRLAGQLHGVAGRAGHEHALREHLAEHRDVDLDHLRRARRRALAPEVLHEPAHRHRATRLEQQARQQRPLCPAAEGDRLPVALDLQRTEQLYAQGGAHYAFPPIATMYSACIRSPPSVASLFRSAIARISSRHSCQRPSALRRSRAFRVGP